jgi:hypothetical protein
MKHLRFAALLLLISATALAQTFSNANLNGSYAFQFGQPQTDTWSKTFSCPTNSAVTYTATGSITTATLTFGTLTYDGNGNVSLSLTNTGQFNSTASAATLSVTWNSTCQVTAVNNGHVVYQAATTNQHEWREHNSAASQPSRQWQGDWDRDRRAPVTRPAEQPDRSGTIAGKKSAAGSTYRAR